MLKCLLPSVSVALLITWVSLVFRLVEVALFLPRLSTRPVPTETTHSSGVLGHKHLDSWIASAVGLLIRRPPSCPRNKREKVFYGKTWGKKNKLRIAAWSLKSIPGFQPSVGETFQDHLMEQKEEIHVQLQRCSSDSSTAALISNIDPGGLEPHICRLPRVMGEELRAAGNAE